MNKSEKDEEWYSDNGYGGFAACYIASTLTPQEPPKPEPVKEYVPKERRPRKYKK